MGLGWIMWHYYRGVSTGDSLLAVSQVSKQVYFNVISKEVVGPFGVDLVNSKLDSSFFKVYDFVYRNVSSN